MPNLVTAFPGLSILVVEDDPLQAHALRLHLLGLGYDRPLEAESVTEAEALFDANKPDLVLLDIHLGGGPDGIELARRLRARRPFLLIFLTSAHDLATFDRATAVTPEAFLTKPYDQATLFRAIELAVRHQMQTVAAAHPTPLPFSAEQPPTPTHWWLRDGSRVVRAPLQEMLYIESDDSYSHFHMADGRKFTVRQALRDIEAALPEALFVRVHRSFLVQSSRVESVDSVEGLLTLGPYRVPIGRAYRPELMRRLGLQD